MQAASWLADASLADMGSLADTIQQGPEKMYKGLGYKVRKERKVRRLFMHIRYKRDDISISSHCIFCVQEGSAWRID